MGAMGDRFHKGWGTDFRRRWGQISNLSPIEAGQAGVGTDFKSVPQKVKAKFFDGRMICL